MTDTFFRTPIRATIRAGEDQVIRLESFTPSVNSTSAVETDQCGGPVRGDRVSWVGWSSLQMQAEGLGDGDVVRRYDLLPRFIGLLANGLITVFIAAEVTAQMQADGADWLHADLFGRSPANLRKRLARFELRLSDSITDIDAPSNN